MSEKMRIRIMDALPIYIDTADIAELRNVSEEEAVNWYQRNQRELMTLLQDRYVELVKYWDVE